MIGVRNPSLSAFAGAASAGLNVKGEETGVSDTGGVPKLTHLPGFDFGLPGFDFGFFLGFLGGFWALWVFCWGPPDPRDPPELSFGFFRLSIQGLAFENEFFPATKREANLRESIGCVTPPILGFGQPPFGRYSILLALTGLRMAGIPFGSFLTSIQQAPLTTWLLLTSGR